MLFSSPTLDSQSGDGPEPFGARLKALREARALTVEQVAEATNIQPETIEAIEAGTIIGSAPAAYARGFVRIYAEHLEANVDQVLEEFDRLCRPERARLYLRGLGSMSHADYRPSRRGRGHPVASAVAIALVAVLALAAGAYVYVHLDDWLGLHRPETTTGTPRTGPREGDTPGTSQTPQDDASLPAADEARFVLAVFADRNAAIKAEVDGSVVDNFVLAKGRLMDWKGHSSVRLQLEDASAVRIYKDGEPITEPLGPGPVTIIYDETGFTISSPQGE